jgi:hypothetical protein
MPNAGIGTNGLLFVVLWAVLAIASTAFFTLNRNAELKQKVWPPYIVGLGLLFLGITYAMGVRPPFLFLAIPVVALIVFLNLRGVQFCTSCGATVRSTNPFSRPTACPTCSAPLGRNS